MISMDDLQGEHDLSRHRVIEIKDRVGNVINKVNLNRHDPFGHWKATLEKGTFPEASPLHGVYTMLDLAERDVYAYISNRNEAVSVIRELTPGPTQEVKAVL